MGVDWAFAGLVGGVGFGAVFVLLIVLGIVIWIVGKIFSGNPKTKTDAKQAK